jgi:hypothetical protein
LPSTTTRCSSGNRSGRLATFKTFLLDEVWLFIKNETIRNYVVQAQKTWRKHNAAMILATQSIKELEESGMLAIVAESCPTKIFLANPEMNREVYREAFHLNDTELDLISGLVPPGQMLIRKAQSSKEVQKEARRLAWLRSERRPWEFGTETIPFNAKEKSLTFVTSHICHLQRRRVS